MANLAMSDSASPLSQCPPPSVPDFKAWLDKRGVVRHEGIDLKYDEGGSGWGIRATRSLDRGTILCGIPRDSILSARTASLQPTTQVEDFAGYVLQLTSCLLHELRLARASEWYGWLQALQRETIEIPTLWADPDLGGEDGERGLKWLSGTEVEKELHKKHEDGLSLADIREYHSSLELPPIKENPDPPSLASFLYAYSLVSSRGFIIDAYHSVGLIPFCDMFNHSSSNPHTSLSNDAGVCETCGSLPRCQHDPESSERLEHLSPDYLAQLVREGMADKVDMRVQRDVKSGEEVMSCYDEDKSNAALLVEYGFVDADSNTRITWGHRDILTPGTLPTFVNIVRSFEPLNDDGPTEASQDTLIGAISENQPEPLQIRSTGEISPTLFLAVFFQHTSTIDAEEVYSEVMKAMSQIRKSDDGNSGDFTPAIRNTINSVIGLLQLRLRGMHRSGSTVPELMGYLETLPSDAKLERLGLQAMLQERNILERCLQRWQGISTGSS